MPETELKDLSEGVARVLEALQPRTNRGESSFPYELPGCLRSQRPVRAWFRDIVANRLGGSAIPLQLEERLAVHGHIKWTTPAGNGRVLTFASLQAIVILDPNSSLTKFLDDGDDQDIPFQYYRLDYDPDCLGAIFREPLAHLHISPDGEPRIPFQCLPAGSIIPEFLEFLYLNHFKKTWLGWAERVWTDTYSGPLAQNPWVRVTEAFNQGKMDLLRNTYSAQVNAIRSALRAKKVSISLPKLPVADAEVSSYQTLQT